MEKISCVDKISNEEVLERVNDKNYVRQCEKIATWVVRATANTRIIIARYN